MSRNTTIVTPVPTNVLQMIIDNNDRMFIVTNALKNTTQKLSVHLMLQNNLSLQTMQLINELEQKNADNPEKHEMGRMHKTRCWIRQFDCLHIITTHGITQNHHKKKKKTVALCFMRDARVGS